MVARRHGPERDTRKLQIRLHETNPSVWTTWCLDDIQRALTCHFKHAGLKLGLPFAASSPVVKICSTFSSLEDGVRNGNSFSEYVSKGNLSKMRFTGAGIENMLRFCAVGCL